MAALSVVGTNLITGAMAPLTTFSGGTSASDPGAGTESTADPTLTLKKITTADRAGAWILTVMTTALVGVGAWWINWE